MPLLYDEVEIDEWTETMLLTERFTPPRNGRMLRFRLSDGSRRKLLYTCIDGNYAGPFSAENGAVTVKRDWNSGSAPGRLSRCTGDSS